MTILFTNWVFINLVYFLIYYDSFYIIQGKKNKKKRNRKQIFVKYTWMYVINKILFLMWLLPLCFTYFSFCY